MDQDPDMDRVTLGIPKTLIARWAGVSTMTLERYEKDRRAKAEMSGGARARLDRVYAAIGVFRKAIEGTR